MADSAEELDARRRSRIIQIPLNGPVRYGTILRGGAGNPLISTLIEWDNGGEEWIRDEKVASLRIWLVGDEKKEPQPTPLEDLLRALNTPRRTSGGQP